jgi:hypothetical protein
MPEQEQEGEHTSDQPHTQEQTDLEVPSDIITTSTSTLVQQEQEDL